ncbi:MAG: hypothetical protein E6X17_05535 [Sporomusaceae bacterium]|nr:hypothetical protein [Sporomusaceae bacterium]
MANDPYKSGKFSRSPYAKKAAAGGPLIAILDGWLEDRGLALIAPISRCIQKDEVHELIVTDEADAQPGARVDRIAYLGFFAAAQSGVLVAGDDVFIDGRLLGQLAGFDETHMPNHLNIVIRAAVRNSGVELGAEPGWQVLFKLADSN